MHIYIELWANGSSEISRLWINKDIGPLLHYLEQNYSLVKCHLKWSARGWKLTLIIHCEPKSTKSRLSKNWRRSFKMIQDSISKMGPKDLLKRLANLASSYLKPL